MNDVREQKGDRLEFATAAYFQAHGYLVRRGVVLSVAAGTAEATDIDLLGIRFSAPLREERLVADCKDRKKPKPFERILWSLGLASFSRAARTVVVTQRPPWQAREFAAFGGVEILGADELESLLKKLPAGMAGFGDADASLSARFEESAQRSGERCKPILRIVLELRQCLVTGHPITNLNRVIACLATLAKEQRQTEPELSWLRRYVIFDSAVIAAAMLVRFAAEIKWTPEAQWTDYARKRLTYGDIPPQKARELAKITFQSQFPDGLPVPQHAEEVVELLKLLLANVPATTSLPNAIDYYLFGHLLGGRPPEAMSAILGTALSDSVRIIKQLVSMLSYASGIEATCWQPSVARGDRSSKPEVSKPPTPERSETHEAPKSAPKTRIVGQGDQAQLPLT